MKQHDVIPGVTVSPWGTFNAHDCIIRLTTYEKGKRWATIIGDCNLDFTRTADGKVYSARVGIHSDGASIPRYAQIITGHPFDQYLEAALVHDQGCRDRTAPAKVVHRVFYEGMRALGVPEWKARLMYTAVLARRPTWKVQDAASIDPGPTL